jgi:hypothetical protein
MNMNKNIMELYEYECEFKFLDSWIQWTDLNTGNERKEDLYEFIHSIIIFSFSYVISNPVSRPAENPREGKMNQATSPASNFHFLNPAPTLASTVFRTPTVSVLLSVLVLSI